MSKVVDLTEGLSLNALHENDIRKGLSAVYVDLRTNCFLSFRFMSNPFMMDGVLMVDVRYFNEPSKRSVLLDDYGIVARGAKRRNNQIFVLDRDKNQKKLKKIYNRN